MNEMEESVEEILKGPIDVKELLSAVQKENVDLEENYNHQFAEETSRIDRLSESMQRVDHLTSTMGNLLSGIETSLGNLQKRLLPVHKRTQALSRSHDNLDQILVAMNGFIERISDVNEIEAKIDAGIGIDLTGFVSNMRKARSNIDFFVLHHSFSGADKIVAKLKTYTSKAVLLCEAEVEKKLKALDLVSYGVKSDDWRFPSDSVGDLVVLSTELNSTVSSGKLQKLVESVRSNAIEKSLLRIPVDDSGDDSFKKRYSRGSHSYISLQRFTLRNLQCERELCFRLLPEKPALHAFGWIAGQGLEVLTDRGDRIVSAEPRSGFTEGYVFSLFDVMHTFHELQESYLEVLKGADNRLKDRFLGLVGKFHNGARRGLDTKQANKVLDVGARSISSNGTVLEITANGMGYLRRLLDYRLVIETLLPMSVISRDTSVGDPADAIGQYLAENVSLLRSNLAAAAKSYKDPALSTLFTINNEVYIMSGIVGSPLAKAVGSRFMKELELDIDAAITVYVERSWSKCFSAMSVVIDQDESLDVTAKAVKQTYSQFNTGFVEQCQLQKRYSVPDGGLRKRLWKALQDSILKMYNPFWETTATMEFSQSIGKYRLYAPDTVSQMIEKFFEEG